jgi:hypothetical protein
MVLGWTLLKLYAAAPACVMALSAALLMMDPFLCLDRYRTSQRLEAGAKPNVGDSLLAWEAGDLRLCAAGAGDAVGPRDAGDLRRQRRRHARPEGLAAGLAGLREPELQRRLDGGVGALFAGLTRLRLVLTQAGAMLR